MAGQLVWGVNNGAIVLCARRTVLWILQAAVLSVTIDCSRRGIPGEMVGVGVTSVKWCMCRVIIHEGAFLMVRVSTRARPPGVRLPALRTNIFVATAVSIAAGSVVDGICVICFGI